MTANMFVISDTHFAHANILGFKNRFGGPQRDFENVHQMDEYMIEKWNSVVRPQDHIYHLGDVSMSDKAISYVGRCNGHKRLVLGNHDYSKMKLYMPFFQKIFSSRRLDKLLLTHIPVHPLSLGKSIANVHGHTHNNVASDHFGKQYINVSVEVVDYTPVALEDLIQLANKRLKQ